MSHWETFFLMPSCVTGFNWLTSRSEQPVKYQFDFSSFFNWKLTTDGLLWNAIMEKCAQLEGRKKHSSQFVWQSQVSKKRWQGSYLYQSSKNMDGNCLNFQGGHSPLPRAKENCGLRPVKELTEVPRVPNEAVSWHFQWHICIRLCNYWLRTVTASLVWDSGWNWLHC